MAISNNITNTTVGQEGLSLASSPATITVTPIQLDPENNSYRIDNDAGIFTDYIVRNKYLKPQNVWMSSITSTTGFNGNSVAFFQLGAPTLLWIADWSALKVGIQPQAPSRVPLSRGWQLLYEYIEPVMIITGGDGIVPLFRLNGIYVFGQIAPSTETLNNVYYPLPPYLDPNKFSRTQPVNRMLRNIIDTGAGGGTTGTGPQGVVEGGTAAPGVPLFNGITS